MRKPPLPLEALAKWQVCLRAANTTVWHEAEWQRFYAFLRPCPTTAAPWVAGELARWVEETGGTKHDVLEAAAVDHPGRPLLQRPAEAPSLVRRRAARGSHPRKKAAPLCLPRGLARISEASVLSP